MKIFEITFTDGRRKIVFAESRMAIRRKYSGILEINRVEIV